MEKRLTVGVAQLVERWIVVPVAVGSNPTTHPKTVQQNADSGDRQAYP